MNGDCGEWVCLTFVVSVLVLLFVVSLSVFLFVVSLSNYEVYMLSIDGWIESKNR